MRKSSLLLMMVVLLLSPFSSLPAQAETQTDGYFRYQDNGDNTVTITGYTGAGGHVDIPDTLGGKSVTKIGVETFAIETAAFSNKGLTSVTIPNGVKEIGNNAFSNNQLTHVEIPNSVTLIGTGAFANNELASVDIPYGVVTIGHTAFIKNKLTSVDIPNSVTSIKMYAFQSNYLTSVTIPDSVTSIGEGVFTLNRLTNVTFEGAVPSIDASSFNRQEGATGFLGWFTDQDFTEPWDRTVPQPIAIYAEWTPFTYTDNPDDVSVTITGYIGTAPEDIVIPKSLGGKSVTAIGENAFRSKNLTSVTIPNTVKTIEEIAFGANKLSSVDIPNSVTSIGPYAFADNELVLVNIANSVNTIGEGAFRDNYLESVIIPDGVTVIKEETFQKNELTNITIPSSVTSIGDSAFQYNQLSNVTIPNGVTAIGKLAFQYNQITNVIISNSVKSIANSAFQHNQLSNVTIPSSVTSIGNNAFFNNQLSKVKFEGTLPSIAFNAFDYQQQNSITNIGWFKDQGFILPWDNIVPHKMTIYAKYSHKVTFDTDGGTVIDQQNIVPNGKVTVPQPPTKSGHSFIGWYKEADTANKSLWDFDNDEVTVDTMLYAKWTPNEYTVTFNVNEGTTIANQTIAYQQKVTEPAPPTKAGHTFAGWYKEEGFQTNWDFDNDEVTADTTLYAKWTPNKYTVAFDANGGTTIANQTIAYQQKATEPALPTKAGHIFAGWYKEADFKSKWDFANEKVMANTTLYAKWVANPMVTPPPVSEVGSSTPSDTESTYTVQFQTNGGTVITNQIKNYNGKIIVPPIPVKEGYTFAGWYTDSALTKEWHFDTDVVRENLTLYAKWVKENKTEQIEIEKEVPTIEESLAEKPIAPACTVSFTDIATSWTREMIEEIAGRCIIKGYPDGTFKPNDPIQRQHVAVLFTRTFDLIPTRNTLTFSDVPTSHLYFEAIMKVYRAGIFDGTDGQFKPDTNITRAQMAKVLVQIFNLTSDAKSTFQDVPFTHWANNYIAILADHGIALGDNGNFRPDESITRAQFVAFMYRAMGIMDK